MIGTNIKYPHLHLVEWPFQITPDLNFYAFMADRSQVKTDIETILRSLSRRNTSTIHLVWSWYGTGKTHTLRHMEYLCRNQYPSLLPIYMEIPKAFKSFSDIYRSFAAALDFEDLRDRFLEIVTSPFKERVEKELKTEYLDMFNALTMLCVGTDQQQDTVFRWLRGEPMVITELRPIGIGKRISTAEDAIRAVTWIIKLVNTGAALAQNEVGRLIWIIDEFQQVGDSKPLAREVNSSLHSIFNRCPNSLSLFISFSGRPQKSYPEWLSRELVDRIGVQKVLVLPPLTKIEAKGFVYNILEHFRTDTLKVPSQFFPFHEATVDMLLDLIEKDKKEIRPRSIMQYFTSVLEIGEPLLQEGKLSVIGQDLARDCLKGRLLEDDEE